MPDVIVISSDEDENEDVFTKVKTRKASDKKEIIDLTVSPEHSNFSLSRSKLNRLRNTTNTIHDTHNNAVENHARRTLPPKESPIKSSPSTCLQIDPAKLNRLRAVLRIELERSPNTKLAKGLKIKKENMDDKMGTLPEGILSPPKYETVSPSPCKKNLLQYLKSSPKRNHLEDVFDKMRLSPSRTPSPKTTPHKTQSTLEHWVTPTKRMRIKQSPVTPNRDINAKRNELVWPPQHLVLDTQEFIKKLYKNPRDFPTTYRYLVESLQDEELLISVVKSIDSFMSSDCAPSSEIIWYLVNNILSSSSSSWLISLTYSLLNDILERYPAKCVGLKITWEDLKKYFLQEKASDDKKSCKTKPCSKLVLSFLLSVLTVELKASALKSKQRRLSKHFSADFDIRHVKDVIPRLKECLENHTATPNATTVCIIGEGRDLPEESSICGLELFQNILKLFMIVSLNKENAAIRLADELMYLYIELPNLQQRVLLLQSVQSHCVRAHLIKVLLMNYCLLLPEALEGHNLQLCVRKIFLQDFCREPPKRSDGHGHSAEDVEEYVTLLAYLLQSYVVIHTPSLHGHHNDYSLCNQDDVEEFSQEDVSYLQDLKFHVSSLCKRCDRFIKEGQLLSLRTNLLLHMMDTII